MSFVRYECLKDVFCTIMGISKTSFVHFEYLKDDVSCTFLCVMNGLRASIVCYECHKDAFCYICCCNRFNLLNVIIIMNFSIFSLSNSEFNIFNGLFFISRKIMNARICFVWSIAKQSWYEEKFNQCFITLNLKNSVLRHDARRWLRQSRKTF